MIQRILLSLFLAALVPLTFAAPASQSEPGVLQPGVLAPDFVTRDAEGKEIRLSDLKGKVVVLDFWATWCGPCIASFPSVEAVAKAHGDDVVVLAVCTSDSASKFDAWVKEHSSLYPSMRLTCDPNSRESDTFEERASSKLYHVAGIPTKFVIDRDGKILLTIVGHEDGDVRLEAGLARAGLKIDPAVVKKGEAQAAEAAREAAERAAAEAANPRPFFAPMFGSVRAGQPMPDFALRSASGEEMSNKSFAGKPVIYGLGWGDVLPRTQLDELHRRYGKYGVQAVGVMVSSTPEEFAQWRTRFEGKYAFTVTLDPAGKFVPTADPPSMEERAAHQAKTVVGQFFKGNMTPPMPVFVLANAEGTLMGSFSSYRIDDAVGNLLMRAGVELQPEDRPSVVVPIKMVAAPAPRQPEARVELIATGEMAPDFPMQDTEGAPIKLSDLRGKVVVLDFWATWCGPCLAALPHVQDLAVQYADQGVVVIASCTSDGRAEFERFVAKNQERYSKIRFAHDPAERTPERGSHRLYGVSGIPHQFVIDRDGKIVAQVGGYMKGEVLLDAALAKAGIKVPAEILEQAAQDQAKRDAR